MKKHLFLIILTLAVLSVSNVWAGEQYIFPVTSASTVSGGTLNQDATTGQWYATLTNADDYVDIPFTWDQSGTECLIKIGYTTAVSGGQVRLWFYRGGSDCGSFGEHGIEIASVITEKDCGAQLTTSKIDGCKPYVLRIKPAASKTMNVYYLKVETNNGAVQSTANITTSELNFVATTTTGDQIITNSDFLYSHKKEDRVKTQNKEGYDRTTFTNGYVTAASRKLYTFETGTYKFTLQVFTEESNTYNKPYVFVNNVVAGGGTYYFNKDDASAGGKYRDWEIEIDVTAGTYPIAFYFPSVNEKLFYRLASVEKKAVSCPGYTFHYGTNEQSDWTIACFENGAETDERVIENFTIPTVPDFYVGWQGNPLANNMTVRQAWNTDVEDSGNGVMNGAMVLLPVRGTSKVGWAQGAVGTLRCWYGSTSKNQYVGFQPNGYAIMYGGNNYAFEETGTANKLETDVVTLPAVSTTYQMGIATADSYVTCAHSNAAEAISNMGVTVKDGGKKKILFNPAIGDGDGYVTDDAKIAVYDVTNSTWDTDFMSDADGDGIYEGHVADNCETIIIARFNKTKTSTGNWSDKYNQTNDYSISGDLQKIYKIDSWCSGDNCKETISSTTTSAHPATGQKGKFRMWDNSADQNWYVHWIPYYVLSYDANGGSGTTAATERNSESSTLTVSVASNGFTAPTGHEFAGWNTLAEGGGDSYAAGASYTLTANGTLYAQWSPLSYTVTLNTNGGTINAGDVTSYTYGTCATLPTDVTKTGYDFGGWYDNSELTGDRVYSIANNVTGNKEYWAKWTAKVYTITNGNPSNGTITVNSTAIEGETVSILATPSSGYAFNEWSIYKTDDASTTISPASVAAATSFTMPAYGVTVTATFVETTCTNTYTIDCGSTADYVVPTSGTRVPSTQSNEAGIYTDHYTGYHGEGYYDFKGADYSEIYYAVHLPAAQYTFEVYTATNKDGQYINVYRRTDGESGDISYGGYYYTKMISQPNSYNNNKAFGVGRTISEQNLAEGDYIIGLYSNGDYAAYDQVVITANSDVFCRASTYDVTITGSPAAGQASATGAGSYEEGETVTINATPNRGYSFNTWSADPSVSFSSSASTASNSFSMPASDVALTASYNTLTSRTVTVNDDGNGSGSADLNPAYVGETVTLTATPNTGYRFVNWMTSDGVSFASSTSASTTFTMLDKNVTVQANFAEVNCVSSRTYQVEDIMITTADAVIHSADDDQADPTYVEVVNSTNNSNSNFHWSDYNGSADGGQYVVNLKSAGSNSNHNTVYMEVVIPAESSYDIQIRAGKGRGKNIWLNVFSTTSTGYKTVTYGGTTYYMVADGGKSVNSSNDSYAWQTTTWENISLPAGKLIIGVYAGYDNATLDWIKITRRDGIGSFCKHTITVNNTSGASSSAIADKSKALSGETVTVTAYDASDGYRFTGWTVTSGSATFADASALSTTFVMPDADVTVQANYASSGYVVNYDVVGNGTISSVVDGSSNPVSSGGRVADGTLLTFTAAPAEGYAVLGWYTWLNSTETLQGNTQNNNTFTYTVTQDITIRVKFDTPYTLTLTSSPAAASATVSGGGSYVKTTVVSVSTSTENGDYTFVHWMDGESEVSTNATFNYVMPEATKTLNAVYRQSRISRLSWSGNEDLGSGIEVASSCFSGGCFDTQVTFTFLGSGTVNYYYNTDRKTPLGTITSGTAITLDDNLRTHGIYIKCTSGSATLTGVEKTTVGSVYTIWSGSVNVSADYTGIDENGDEVTLEANDGNDWWLQQVVLGPEHFQTAAVGDTLRVTYIDKANEYAKGAIQTATKYNAIPGNIYKESDGSQVTTNTHDFDLPNSGYYHIITAGSLDSLQHKGIVVKGKGHTITRISLHATCSNLSLRTTAPDITTRSGEDIMATSIDFGDGFNLGNWEQKLELDESCFTNVTVGSIINLYMSVDGDATLSFRCNVPSIIADDKRGGVGCPSYGDISFDRTIDDLYGNTPSVVGETEGYKVMYLKVDADMMRRLKETGMILCGKGTLIKVVEGVPDTVVVNPGVEKEVPTVVNNIVIYQGGQVTNEEDIMVLGSITYIRPAKDDGESGKLYNKLDQWYTFALPFTVSDVEVYDVADERWYDINAVYYSSDETNQTTINPDGAGHYYLQYLKAENETAIGKAFAARWQYITPGHSLACVSQWVENDGTRYGYPKKDEAYIILFDSDQPIGDYFQTNTQIRFVGVGPQTIDGVAKKWKVEADGEQYWMYANNTLHSFTLTDAYILNEAGTYFELQSEPTIRPFECYVQATESLKAKYAAIPMRGFRIDNTTTGAESIQGSAIRAEKILRNGQLIIIRNGVEYDATGVVNR